MRDPFDTAERDNLRVSLETRRQRRDKWPKFFNIARNLHAAVVNFGAIGSGDLTFPSERLEKDNVPLGEANAVGSSLAWSTKLRDGRTLLQPDTTQRMHFPLLDLDVAHCYIPSSTPGHAHLILATPVCWHDYVELLRIMDKCGILQHGYVEASLKRGETWIRAPWTKKEEK